MVEEGTNGDVLAELGSTDVVQLGGPSAPRLLIVAADGTCTSRALPAGGALVIGRGAMVDVRLDERAVSRRHARLEVGGAGELRLIDLDSANGTWVGGTLVRDIAVAVQPGEPIRIGTTVLVVHELPLARAAERAPRRHRPGGAMAGVDALIAKAASTLQSVLLLGETGVGKGVAAERLHRLSARAGRPLVQLNCAGLSAALLEIELFGHEQGAFSGAAQARPGLLEAAAGGTVFIDEIGELPVAVQAKLLLAIEHRVTRRAGATGTTPIDVRFICATHRDVEAEIGRGRIRRDFLDRISQLTIRIPPLRERRDEIDGLVGQIARDVAASLNRERLPELDDDARAALHRHEWPGNIRELRNVIECAIVLTAGDAVTPRILAAAGLAGAVMRPPGEPIEVTERDRVIAALAACGGNQSRAARMLGVARNTLIRRIQKHNLMRPRLPADSPGNVAPSSKIALERRAGNSCDVST
jgi:two-component system, NtrC family, response regulator AtoC